MEQETRTIDLRVGNETRTVQIERFGNGCWYAKELCVGKYRTGVKLHMCRPQVVEQNGRWFLVSGHRISSRSSRLTPIAFYDEAKHKPMLAR